MEKPLYVEPYQGSSPYIFISYAHADKHLIQPILARLEQEGYRFWYDHGIHGGEEWARVIANHVKQCAALLLFVSSASMISKSCTDELAYAQNNQKPVIMIMLEQDVQIPDDIDMRTSRYQRLFMNRPFNLDELLYEMNVASALSACRGEHKSGRFATAAKPTTQKRKPFRIKTALIVLLAVLVIVAVALVGGKLHKASDIERPATEQLHVETTTTTIQQEVEKDDEEVVADSTPVTASLNDLVSLQQHYEFVQFPKYDVFGTLHASYYNFGLDWVTNETETAWILNKEYTTFSCEITFLDDVATAENLSVSFYADDQLVHFEPDFSNQSRVRTVSFDVSGAQKLTIKATYQGSGFSNPYCNFVLVNDTLEK